MTMHCCEDVFLADTARVLGEVTIGRDASIWYGAVIRGDVAPVTIGEAVNVQDNAVIHCDTDVPNVIGPRVSIGHGAIVHGRSIGEGTLIGMRAVVLGGTDIGRHCLIAAGAVVTPGLTVPDHSVVLGTPGRITRQTSDREKQYLDWLWRRYIELSRHHHEHPDAPTVRPWRGKQT